MSLVIVESPTKAKTISKFLGKEYNVESSYGHVRDLPKSKLGVDIEKDFEPHYIIPVKAKKNVNALKKLAAKASEIILATDEDREGEAIAWHLVRALDLDKLTTSARGGSAFGGKNSQLKTVSRIVFHEITESAINEALKNPRPIDSHLVDAQQARRVLDRLVGYQLSPFLWKKIMRGLSAGRVQSVALRLIVEREEEIRKFKPEEYWTIGGTFKKEGEEPNFEATLVKIGEKALEKMDIKTGEEAEKIAMDLETSDFSVGSVEKKETRRNPLPPFITSTLQQEANKRLRMSAKQTMRFAQQLYEKGFITYMRTDSVNLSKESLVAARNLIKSKFGKNYLLPEPRYFKTKSRLAQEAHEAIRPTNPSLAPEEVSVEEPGARKIYDLIWRRFIASQLPQAVFDATSAAVLGKSKKETYELSATGNMLKFDGFLKVWPQKLEERELPMLEAQDPLALEELKPEEHHTEPPPRYNEASLIKALEEYGIGRPSTYAPTISVIQTRNYVEKNEARRFQPTEIGELVNKLLTENFPEVVDIQFTARMEEELDLIAEGKMNWRRVIREFYEPFSKNLEKKYESVKKSDFAKDEKTDEVCEKCGKPMVIKTGRFGKFLACSGFPECKNAKSLKKNIGIKNEAGEHIKCPKCAEGEIVRKRTKRGRFFYGCTRYPDCDYASWTNPTLTAKNKLGEGDD